MARTGRTVLAGAPHLVALAPAVVLTIVEWDRLPATVASRFSASGAVVGELPRPALLVVTMLLGVGLALTFGLIAGRTGGDAVVSRTDTTRFFGVLSWATAGFVGAVLFVATEANVGISDAAAAHLPPGRLLVALGVGAAAGCVGYLVTPATPARPPAPATEPLRIGDGERVSWTHRATSRSLQVVGALLVAAGLVLGWFAGPLPGVILVVAAVAVLLFGSSATVTVDRHGLTVALGVLGRPRLRIPVEDVVEVTTGTVSPAQFGGWGYRIVPGGSGVVLRSGPALIVTRRSGRRFTVTVDDAPTAAGLLSGLARQGA